MEEVLDIVTPIQGVGRAFVDRAGKIPQLQIEVDRERAARYGLSVADIEDVIETALGGGWPRGRVRAEPAWPDEKPPVWVCS